ncbi:MAG: acyl carrier protein [Sulfitobacter sp.]
MTVDPKTAALLAEALGMAPAEITNETGLETTEGWDSLAHFRVVLAVEEAIGRSLSTTEIFETVGYESVNALLQPNSEA